MFHLKSNFKGLQTEKSDFILKLSIDRKIAKSGLILCDIKVKERLSILSHIDKNIIKRKQNYELKIIKIGQFVV